MRVSQQASPEQSRKIAALTLYGVFTLAVVVGVAAWFVWHTAIAVLVAIGMTGGALLILGLLVMMASMMRTKYPLRAPKGD